MRKVKQNTWNFHKIASNIMRVNVSASTCL